VIPRRFPAHAPQRIRGRIWGRARRGLWWLLPAYWLPCLRCWRWRAATRGLGNVPGLAAAEPVASLGLLVSSLPADPLAGGEGGKASAWSKVSERGKSSMCLSPLSRLPLPWGVFDFHAIDKLCQRLSFPGGASGRPLDGRQQLSHSVLTMTTSTRTCLQKYV
jgi:hypothetical protein